MADGNDPVETEQEEKKNQEKVESIAESKLTPRSSSVCGCIC